MIIKHRKKAFILSLILILASLLSMGYHMVVDGFGTLGLNLGIDFAGGTVLQLNLGEEFDVTEVEEILDAQDIESASVQTVRTRDEDGEYVDEGVLIKTRLIDEAGRDRLMDAMMERWPEMDQEDRSIESVGAAVGSEQKKWSAIALAVALICMIIYITLRFEFRFALATIGALIHDVIIVVGIFSLLRFDINITFVAALLTIVGYSINDSIVIIDRIRENLTHKLKKDYAEVVDRSIMQCLNRSINTSLTTLMVLIALMVGFYLFVGNLDLVVFVVAMIVGVVMGTYSSIFIASPLWLTMKENSLKAEARKKATTN